MFPCKMQTVHQLLPSDRQLRIYYSQTLLNLNRNKDNFAMKFIMSDEAHFHLCAHVN